MYTVNKLGNKTINFGICCKLLTKNSIHKKDNFCFVSNCNFFKRSHLTFEENKSLICEKMYCTYINGWMVISNLVISLMLYNLTRKLVNFIFHIGFLWFSLPFFFSFKKMKALSNWKFQLWFLLFFSSNICMWIAC